MYIVCISDSHPGKFQLPEFSTVAIPVTLTFLETKWENVGKHLITARNLSRRKKNGDEETPPVMSTLGAAASIALFYTIPFCFYFAWVF